jgi:GT2 family glycosyltransferase
LTENRADAATIVIPVWNRADLLRKLLDTISTQTRRPDEVIVVDNASVDDAAQVAQRWGARVIPLGSNRGFAAAVNRGIEECGTAWVAVVNSDVELRPDWLAGLMNAGAETNAWFVTGKILSAAGGTIIDGSWDLIAKSGCAWRAGHGKPDAAAFSRRRTISMSSATAVLYRRKLFEVTGPFEESYESYLEDVDLSLRCMAAGLTGVYEPAAVCTHAGSASTGRWSHQAAYLNARNQDLLVRRVFSIDMRRDWRWKIAVGRLLWGLVALRHGRLRAWLRGKRDARRIVVPEPSVSIALRQSISAAEREIFELQRLTGWDWYWRLYFWITGGESE